MDNDAIPTVGTHRGVPLEDHQSDARLALVRAEIDRVLGMTDARELADWAADSWHSPESRQLAVAMAESMWTVARDTRQQAGGRHGEVARLDRGPGQPAMA
jgi:hypothetical protein